MTIIENPGGQDQGIQGTDASLNRNNINPTDYCQEVCEQTADSDRVEVGSIEQIFHDIVSTFGGQIQSDGSYNIHCPGEDHEDKTPSCNVKNVGDKIIVYCFGGCSQEAVIAALKSRNLWPQKVNGTEPNLPPGIWPIWTSRGSKIAKRLTACWEYKDQTGQTIGYTARYDDHFGDKDVIPYFKKSGDQWKVGGPKGKPIYGAEYLKDKDKPVLIIEGEKTRDAAKRFVGKDYICIAWLGGTGSVNKVDWTPIQGREVFIWPDNDKPGIKAAKAIQSKISNARIISPPADVPEKWDLADALADGWTRDQVMEHIKTAAGKPLQGAGTTKTSFNLESFSLSGMTKKMKQQMLDDVHILGRVALLGQLTIWFAPFNAGKTLLLLYLLIQSIRNGILKGEDVFYCNADDSFKGLVCKNELAEQYGFHELAPGQGPDREHTFKSENLIEYIQLMIDSGSVHGKVIILDTYKKFTDPMSKGKSKDFFSKLREFALGGGTVVMLAHVNKHRNEDKKVVYEGVADGANDPDCAYTLDIVSEANGIRTIKFECFKSRGDVATEASYSYDCTPSLTYLDRLASVKEVGEEDLKAAEEQRKARKKLVKQRPLIDAITACINEGITTKIALIKEAAIRCEKSQAKVTNVLRERTGTDHSEGHMWFTEPGNKNTTHYRLNIKVSEQDGEDLS
jgi:5S rRNA maturation endonuclease (ribonuclease M5)